MPFLLRGLLPAFAVLMSSTAALAEVDRLAYFITFGRADDVQLVLQQGANPNARDAQGWPLLAVAASRHDSEGPRIVQLLTEAGADVNAADEQKHYPLLVAIKESNAPVVQYLLSKGASIAITNKDGVSALTEAQRGGNPQIRQAMQQAATELAAREEYARSPEHRYELLREYAKADCGYYYWSYYLSSRQEEDEAHQKSAQASQAAMYQRLIAAQNELVRNFQFDMESVKFKFTQVQTQITDNLDALISNRNRRAKGVGTQSDLDARCSKIVLRLFPDMPVRTLPVPAPAPSAAPVAPVKP